MDVIIKAQLKLKSAPISTNSAYFARNRKFNQKARKWRANFLTELQKDYNQNQMNKIKSVFNPKKHMLRVIFHWYQPQEVILTQDDTLSLRSMDVDNILKIPTDCIFDKKYCTKWLEVMPKSERSLYSISSIINLDINDKFIFSTTSIKLPSQDSQYHCLVDLEVVPVFQRI